MLAAAVVAGLEGKQFLRILPAIRVVVSSCTSMQEFCRCGRADGKDFFSSSAVKILSASARRSLSPARDRLSSCFLLRRYTTRGFLGHSSVIRDNIAHYFHTLLNKSHYFIPALVLAKREISSMTVLLPAVREARFKLEATGGSYAWRSKNPGLVEVHESDDRTAVLALGKAASTSTTTSTTSYNANGALVAGVAENESSRKATIVAKDRVSGEEMRCEVYVADIARIEVVGGTVLVVVAMC